MWRRRLSVASILLVVLAAVSCVSSRATMDRAASDKTTSFTWVVFADHLDRPARGLIDRIAEIKPALVVDVGDVVFESKPDEFRTVKKLIIDPLAAVGAPLYPVAGNHDFPVRPHWFEFWAPPANKLYYSFDYGNSHFIVLDTNKAVLSEGGKTEDQKYEPGSEYEAIQTQAESFRPGSRQYEWLRRDLAGTDKKHVFVFFHEPAFSYSGHDGDAGIQRHLCPLFEQHQVTAVFSGHSHSYERFVPLRVDLSSGRPVAVPDEKNGVVYIVTAGGGMPLYDITPNPMHAATAKAFHFVRVEVNGESVRCTVIEAETGKVLDSFQLKSRRR